MRTKCCVLSFCCFFFYVTASSFSQEFARLPRIFYLNETEECPEDHFYCKVEVKLKPRNPGHPPQIWEQIKKETMYRRDFVFRAFCIGGESIEDILEKELIEYDLKGDIVRTYCNHKRSFLQTFGLVDIIIGFFILTYYGFVITCTIKTSSPKNNANEYQQIFSMINVWKEINSPRKNEDFNNLISFQGIRTLAMIFIVAVHSFFTTMILSFVRNPEYFEEVPNSLVKTIFHNSFGLVVQIYFIISAWLLSVHLNNIVKKNGQLTWKDLVLLWMNRYFRLLPAIMLTLLFHYSDAIAVSISHPYFYSLSRGEAERCRINWWKNLLFIQNINVQENGICSPGMWFVAADLQMYIIISACFYIHKRCKISMKYFLALIAIVSASIQVRNVISSDFDGLVRFSPRLLPPESFMSLPEIAFSYVATYGSSVTYIIGFIFGTYYWRNKNTVVFDTMVKKIAFCAAFFGIPIFACYIYGFRSNRVVEAILSVIVRPLFSFGIAVGLLAMATGTGGPIKSFFESAPMVFLGNTTYSTYMFHFLLVFGRAVYSAKYTELNDFYCFSNWIIDIVLSFIIGLIMHITLEHPFIKLQKMMLPQISIGNKNK